ncbi:MAG: helix-turn-helix domain-containing protein [Actinobacteria bacterium]|nr:helix-turn-helix domain-containing protein [Actinomycetota bacterium]
MTDLEKRRLALGDRLRELRVASGLSGKRLAERAGWPASKVSRIENAKQAVSDSDVRAWCDITGAPESVAAGLRDQLRNLRLEAASVQRQGRGAQRCGPAGSGDFEQTARTMRIFELSVVPELVQTAEYARHVLITAAEWNNASVDIELAVQARMERQRVLYSPDSDIEITLSETALRLTICPPEVLGAQIDRLLALQGLPGIRFGMLPLDLQLPVQPMHGFWIVGDVVLIKTMTGEIVTGQAQDLAVYRRTAEALASVALVGNQARALLGGIADGLRTH